MKEQRVLLCIFQRLFRSPCMCVYVMYELVKKKGIGSCDLVISEIAKRLNNISNHTRRI